MENWLLLLGRKSFDSEHPEWQPESHRVGEKEESVLLIDRIRKKFDERNDTFVSGVRKRLLICADLVASEAVYHSHCHAQFILNKPKTQTKLLVDLSVRKCKLPSMKCVVGWRMKLIKI